MKNSDLKNNLHVLVDRIENQELLENIFSFLKHNENQASGKYWELLSEKQKQEVSTAYEDSEDEDKWKVRENSLNLSPATKDVETTKLELIQILLETENMSMLEKVRSVLSKKSGDWWDDLSDEEKKEVDLGLQDIKNGNVVDHKQVKEIFSKWRQT